MHGWKCFLLLFRFVLFINNICDLNALKNIFYSLVCNYVLKTDEICTNIKTKENANFEIGFNKKVGANVVLD